MKQILLISILAALAVLAFAAEPRCFWWEVRLDGGDLREYVDSQNMDVSSTGWLVEAVSSGEPGFVLSSATHHNYLIKIVDGGNGLLNRCWVYVDQQRWTENWAIGDTLTVTLTWLPTGKSASLNYVIQNLFEDFYFTDVIIPGTTWVLPKDLFVAEEPEEKAQD